MMAPWEPTPSFWRDRSVAVTGATGFVGFHLTAALASLGASVVALVRDHLPETRSAASALANASCVAGDISDQAVLERLLGEYDVKTVIHLAAQSQVGVANRGPVGTFESNVRGTWTLLEAVRRSSTVEQVVAASSDKAYGSHAVLPYTEDTPLAAVIRTMCPRPVPTSSPRATTSPSRFRSRSPGAGTSSVPATSTGTVSFPAPSGRCSWASDL